MKNLPPCREPSGRLNHPGSSVSPLSARGRDKDRILYGLAILLMAASMAGQKEKSLPSWQGKKGTNYGNFINNHSYILCSQCINKIYYLYSIFCKQTKEQNVDKGINKNGNCNLFNQLSYTHRNMRIKYYHNPKLSDSVRIFRIQPSCLPYI